nr:MAG TPA: hypothetical protein [Microviridae sp.]
MFKGRGPMGPLALCCSHGQGGRVGCFNQIQPMSGI